MRTTFWASWPPFANAVVDSVTTLSPGDVAQVNVTFDGINVLFTFSFPRGTDGLPGSPGEVTNGDLSNALANVLANCSNGSNGVALLLPANPAPTAMDVALKLDELIQALRR